MHQFGNKLLPTLRNEHLIVIAELHPISLAQ
jgi:hypothetical protein